AATHAFLRRSGRIVPMPILENPLNLVEHPRMEKSNMSRSCPMFKKKVQSFILCSITPEGCPVHARR
ncbi:MAG TPA: hypothetical protein VJW77_05435, partial [Terriglobia bacterium]|nr:hypothetical protein [Terriglobia bacterium]